MEKDLLPGPGPGAKQTRKRNIKHCNGEFVATPMQMPPGKKIDLLNYFKNTPPLKHPGGPAVISAKARAPTGITSSSKVSNIKEKRENLEDLYHF